MFEGGGESTRGIVSVVICAIAAIMILSQTPTSAGEESEPIAVNGTWALVSSDSSAKTVGKNTIMTLNSEWNVAGDLVGTYNCSVRAIVFSTGEIFVSEWGLYTVAWGDNEGTIRVRNVGWSVGIMMFHLDTTIVGGGTGDLAKLRGYGSVDLNFIEGTAQYSLEVFWVE